MSMFTTGVHPRLIGLSLLVLASACTAREPTRLQADCSSRDCMALSAKTALYKQCISHLFRYPARRLSQEAIDREFRYPLTSAASYYTWLRMGGTGPSPESWCRSYAHRKYHNPIGWSMGGH